MELLGFCNAVNEATKPGAEVDASSGRLAHARASLERGLGTDALHETAATFAIFNGLVRVADGTGIQVDAGVLADSADFRSTLGVDGYAGSANTRTEPVTVDRSSVTDLFA